MLNLNTLGRLLFTPHLRRPLLQRVSSLGLVPAFELSITFQLTLPERTKPVTIFRAVQEALPDLNQGINHTGDGEAMLNLNTLGRLLFTPHLRRPLLQRVSNPAYSS
jgi:hypothetical protein